MTVESDRLDRLDHLDAGPTTPILTRSYTSAKIKVVDFDLTDKDRALKDALLVWREAEYENRFMGEMFLGPSLVMPLGILDRIVAVCHVDRLKILSLRSLCEQTEWNVAIASLYWAKIYDIIKANNEKYPAEPSISQDCVPVLVSSSRQTASQIVDAATEDGIAPKRRKITCSACKQVGHMGTL